MTNRHVTAKLRFLSALAVLLPVFISSAQARGPAPARPGVAFASAVGQDAPAPFADPLFQQVWTHTDAPVQQGEAQRSWYWGPEPGKTLNEPYAGSKTGTRLVQYFDKARMEVNNPDGDRTSPWFVTTGLLVSEMVAGRQQVGDTLYKAMPPAEIAVGGDGLGTDPDAPTYTSFRPHASLKGPDDNRAPDRTGQPVTATINRAGTLGDNPAMGYYPGTTIVAYSQELGHNIPQAMWDFLNLKGPVEEGGALTDDQTIANWVFVMGYPITEAYWARIQIDGVFYDALLQMYQRRSLAYVPSMPEGWRVQMGNVGAHYYRWLYGGPLPAPLVQFTPTPTATTVPTATPILPAPTSTAGSGTASPTPIPGTPAVTPLPTDEPPPPDETGTPTPTYPPVPTEPPGGFIVSVHPPYGPPDGQFTFAATGLAPNEGVQVQFTTPDGDVVYPAGSNNGQYVAGPDGTLSITLVPTQAFPAAPTGTWLFQVQGLQSGLVGTAGFTLQ
jgi:hypothetical protein